MGERVFEKDRMTRINARGQHAEGRDDFDVASIRDRNEVGFRGGVCGGDGRVISRVDFEDSGFFVDNFRLEIAGRGETGVGCPADGHAEGLSSAGPNSRNGYFFGQSFLKSEWIEGRWRRRPACG